MNNNIFENEINYNGNKATLKIDKNIKKPNEIRVVLDEELFKKLKVEQDKIYLLLDPKIDLTKNENKNLLSVYIQILTSSFNLQNPNIKITFIVNSKKEETLTNKIASDLKTNFDINCEMIKIEEYIKLSKKIEDLSKSKDNKQNNITAFGSKSITKEENGKIKEYIISGDKIYDNNYININDRKQEILNNWINNSEILEKISNYTEEQIDEELTKEATSTIKEYRLEQSLGEEKKETQSQSIASKKAYEEDGKVNTELNIVENNIYKENKYSVVEENGKVVNPNVGEQSFTSNNTTTNITSSNNVEYYEEEIQEREIELKNYFYDEEYNIYDEEYNQIGKIGQDGLTIDDNNNLLQNGKIIGVIGGNLNEIDNTNELNKEKKGPVKVLVKPNNNYGFGNIPIIVITIILSLIVFIGLYLIILK